MPRSCAIRMKSALTAAISICPFGGRGCNTSRRAPQRSVVLANLMMRALGLMSGTSVDGVDVAMIETDGESIAGFGPCLTVPYPDEVRRAIRAAFGAEQPNAATREAERLVTEMHVGAVKRWSVD